jgi:hypothetical protein
LCCKFLARVRRELRVQLPDGQVVARVAHFLEVSLQIWGMHALVRALALRHVHAARIDALGHVPYTRVDAQPSDLVASVAAHKCSQPQLMSPRACTCSRKRSSHHKSTLDHTVYTCKICEQNVMLMDVCMVCANRARQCGMHLVLHANRKIRRIRWSWPALASRPELALPW